MDAEGYFAEPVDEELADAPGYYAAVRHPMDFATMRASLQRDHYVTWRAFVHEFELICHNAVGFNRKGSRIHRAALQVRALTRRAHQGGWKTIRRESSARIRTVGIRLLAVHEVRAASSFATFSTRR